VLQSVALCIAVETSDLGMHSRLHSRRHPSYSIICLGETLHLFGSNPPLKAALQRDSFHCIIVQTSDLGVHSRRHPSNYIKAVLQCVAVCCSVLQSVAECCRVFAGCCSVLQCVAVCCRVFAGCCSVL